MQAIEARTDETNRRRVEAVLETLAGMRSGGGTLGEVAHDARNMVTALSLYCDLLSEPGVLAPEFIHYGNELRLIAAASRRLIEKLTALDSSLALAGLEPVADTRGAGIAGFGSDSARSGFAVGSLPDQPIDNLQEELLENRNLLDAITGLAISLSVRTEGGARPVRLTSEDLTRVLVNLVKNSAEAMRRAGAIEITLSEVPDAQGAISAVSLVIEDSGPGIPAELLETVFDAGFTTHTRSAERVQDGGWPVIHRGLGLSITRSIVEAAGGRIQAANRPRGGARFVIELPTRAHRSSSQQM